MNDAFNSVLKGISLSRSEAYGIAKKLIEEDFTPEQIAGFLIALRMKDETSSELLGFVDAFRETAPVSESIGVVDGVTATVDEATPDPTALVATTAHIYAVPLTRLFIVTGENVADPVSAPGLQLAV